jgi:hypothetical protein
MEKVSEDARTRVLEHVDIGRELMALTIQRWKTRQTKSRFDVHAKSCLLAFYAHKAKAWSVRKDKIWNTGENALQGHLKHKAKDAENTYAWRDVISSRTTLANSGLAWQDRRRWRDAATDCAELWRVSV